MSQEYADLIERVRNIDGAAADYLENEAIKLKDFEYLDKLSHCFVWEDTPQGVGYWSGLSNALGEWD